MEYLKNGTTVSTVQKSENILAREDKTESVAECGLSGFYRPA